MSRSFLWKHGNSAGLHLLNWNSVKMPLKLGGLGLKDLHAFRISLLALYVLKLLNKADLPWVHLFLEKYGFILPGFYSKNRRRSSWLWRSFRLSFQERSLGFKKLVGSGSCTPILDEPWLFAVPISRMPTYVNINCAGISGFCF